MIDMNKRRNASTRKTKEKSAQRFLCIVLACIVIFLGVVCVSVNNRNKKLITEQGKTTTEKTDLQNDKPKDNNAVKNPAENGTPSAGEPSTEAHTDADFTEPETQEETQAETAGVTAIAPGTIENPAIITIDENDWHLTLVNSSYRIPEDYQPDLVYVCGSSERLDKKVATHYERMYTAAQKEGINLAPCSGYRSYELQERNYNRKVEFFESQGYPTEEAKVKAATIIMPPGSSEHNLGYAMDIVCVEEWFEGTPEFQWLQENAADYGFILRYPKDKQDITKVIYEPWHWRYVGVELAKELKSSGLVLEEYMGVAN